MTASFVIALFAVGGALICVRSPITRDTAW